MLCSFAPKWHLMNVGGMNGAAPYWFIHTVSWQSSGVVRGRCDMSTLPLTHCTTSWSSLEVLVTADTHCRLLSAAALPCSGQIQKMKKRRLQPRNLWHLNKFCSILCHWETKIKLSLGKPTTLLGKSKQFYIANCLW